MSVRKLRQLQRLRVVRERLRDAAAAVASQAHMEREKVRRSRSQVDEKLASIESDASQRMSVATDVRQLERVAQDVRWAKRALLHADAALARAGKEVARATDALRAKERELRTTDKLVERTRVALRREVDKNEQRMGDDIAAAAHTRSARG